MKKLTRKLFLSVAALAVCAATLVSTTFAWYVSNSEATVSGVEGTTAGAATQGNLMVADVAIAANGDITESGSWGNKLTAVAAKSLPALNPVTKDDNTANMVPATGATGWHDVDGNPVDEYEDDSNTGVAYGYFAFGIWSTEKTSIALKLGVANTTQNLVPQTLYNEAGAPYAKVASASTTPSTAVSLNETFTKDAVEALRVEIFIGALAGANLKTASAFTTQGVMDSTKFKNADLNAAYATDVTKFATGGNANSYFTAIGNAPVGGTAAKDEIANITSITLSKNVKTVVLVKYWLEGTDTDCFDSCVGQSFSFKFGFEAQ